MIPLAFWLCLLFGALFSAPAVAIGSIQVQIGQIEHPALPEPMQLDVRCDALNLRQLRCDHATLNARIGDHAQASAQLSVTWHGAHHWQADVQQARATLTYNSADGRIATDQATFTVHGQLGQHAGGWHINARLRADGGQMYREPFFVDAQQHPIDVELETRPTSEGAQTRMHITQTGVGNLTVEGLLTPQAWTQPPHLLAHIALDDADAASALYLQPLLATTPLQGTQMHGQMRADLTWHAGQLAAAHAQLDDLRLHIPRWQVTLERLRGVLHWRATQDTAPPSELAWDGGQIGKIPLGASRFRLRAHGHDLALLEPATLPILDGGVHIETLAIAHIGQPQLSARFAADVLPISLSKLCAALGWPEFSGTLAGRLPGLTLQDQRLTLDGSLHADVFDGTVSVTNLQVLDPLGVLPRIRTDLHLRQLDLAAVTSAFNFGGISGRLDGDITGLRLLGWQPVAMDAHLYSSPGDRSRKRISQRAIDSISAAGGGPTGVLSRGALRFFDAFAYRSIGWRCVLNNGVCQMSGVRAQDADGSYPLVQGHGVPRIDIIGHNPRVSWPIFMAQLKAALNSGGVEVR